MAPTEKLRNLEVAEGLCHKPAGQDGQARAAGQRGTGEDTQCLRR